MKNIIESLFQWTLFQRIWRWEKQILCVLQKNWGSCRAKKEEKKGRDNKKTEEKKPLLRRSLRKRNPLLSRKRRRKGERRRNPLLRRKRRRKGERTASSYSRKWVLGINTKLSEMSIMWIQLALGLMNDTHEKSSITFLSIFIFAAWDTEITTAEMN